MERDALWRAYCCGGFAELENELKKPEAMRVLHRVLVGPDARHTVEVRLVDDLRGWDDVRRKFLAREEERLMQDYAGLGREELGRALEAWRQNVGKVGALEYAVRSRLQEGAGLEQVLEYLHVGEEQNGKVGRKVLEICGGEGRLCLYPESPELLYLSGKTEAERFEIARKVFWAVYCAGGSAELWKRIARHGTPYGYPVGPAQDKFIYVRAVRGLSKGEAITVEFDRRLGEFLQENTGALPETVLKQVQREAKKYVADLLAIAERGQMLLEERMHQDREHGWIEPVLAFLQSQERKLIKWSLAEIELDAEGRGMLNLRALLPFWLYRLRPQTIQVSITHGYDKAGLLKRLAHFQRTGGMGDLKADQSGLFREASMGMLRQMRDYRIRFESWVGLAKEELEMRCTGKVTYTEAEVGELHAETLGKPVSEQVKKLMDLSHLKRREVEAWKRENCVPAYEGGASAAKSDDQAIQVTLPDGETMVEVCNGIRFLDAIGAFEGAVVDFFRNATWHIARLMGKHGVKMPALFELMGVELQRRLGEGSPCVRFSEEEVTEVVLGSASLTDLRVQKRQELREWVRCAIISEREVATKSPEISQVHPGVHIKETGLFLPGDRRGG